MFAKRWMSFFLLAGLIGALLVPGSVKALQVGQLAPDFTLPATTGKKISLSQFRGKNLVLVEFYVGDFGPT